MYSSRFKELVARVRVLREYFLPSEFSPTGQYEDKDLDLTRAFQLLCHAEIEDYIETVCRDLIKQKVAEAKSTGEVSKTTFSLMMYQKLGFNEEDGDFNSIDKVEKDPSNLSKTTADVLDHALTRYCSIVKSNHGIKTEDIRKLVKPTGVEYDDLDVTWLNEMNSFAGLRGKVAHTTSVNLTQQPDPQSEYKNICGLLKGLKKLDSFIFKLS